MPNSEGPGLWRDYLETRDPSIFDEFISRNRSVTDAEWSTPEGRDRAQDVLDLCRRLTGHYRASGDGHALHVAVELADSMDLRPDNPLHIQLTLEQAVRLRHRSTVAGRPEDLERAVALLRGMVAEATEGTRTWAVPASNLAVCLDQRFRRQGRVEDLGEAITLHEKVLTVRPADTVNLAGRTLNLGTSLYTRWQLFEDPDDLDGAVSRLESALRLYDGPSWERPGFLVNLATALGARAETERGSSEDAERAEGHYREAHALGQHGSHVAALAVSGLAEMAARRAQRRTDVVAVDADIREITSLQPLAERQVKIAADVRAFLAQAKAARHRLTRSPADLAAATEAYRICVQDAQSDPSRRLTTAESWAEWAEAGGAGARDSAAEAFGHAQEATWALVTQQYRRAHKETWISRAPYLGDRAAHTFASPRAEDLETAVRAAEEGRALLLREALRESSDTEALRAAGHDALADRLERTGTRLALVRESGSAEDVADALRRHGAVLAEARATGACPPAEEHVDIQRVRAAATRSGTHLAYVVAARDSGMALIVAPDDGRITSVRLPKAGHAEAARRAETYLRSYEEHKRAPSRDSAWYRGLETFGIWCWTAIAGPLLDALPPRAGLTLLPGGALRLLPLQLAHTPPGPDGRVTYLTDDRPTAFAPSALALLGPDRPTDRPSVAVVCAPGEREPLPHAPLEAREVQRHHLCTEPLLAGRAETLERLRRSSLVHLTCHATADLHNPLGGGLELADGRLTLREILRHRTAVGGLAVLSACETAMTGVKLPNEAIGLPTGLLQAGFRAVVGSHWRVDELSTAVLMSRFHELLSTTCPHPAEALRRAQKWLREATNEEMAELFPFYGRATGTLRPAARRLWNRARPYAHPYHWCSMSVTGSWAPPR
ncbi:CHAT domain-containing protein [Streptomyces sp. I05A-00742]|uniref:CHAT domain-containing protein n=1 Tax=Streptomyces sp. I05A-00742 TaxID=2732853 RepID=UPI001489EC5F|nr:CHAT domain-containing protein [Streptomyces sp. I05A-00742]